MLPRSWAWPARGGAGVGDSREGSRPPERRQRSVADGFLLPENAQQTLEEATQAFVGAPQQCEDGIDDDGDGLADFADPKCSTAWLYWEKTPPFACGLGAELSVVLPFLTWIRRARESGRSDDAISRTR